MEVLFFILFVALAVLSCADEASNKRGCSNQHPNMQFLHTMDQQNQMHQQLMNQQNQMHQQLMDQQNQMDQQFNQWAMDESIKSVTPFEMGGYDMSCGNSFNDFGGGFGGFGF